MAAGVLVGEDRRMSAGGDGGTVGTEEFDEFFDGLDYPMFIVTTADERRRAGCLVGFTTQASIHPARMLVCLSVQNHTYDVARVASALAVHVVDHDQRDLAGLFGSLSGDDVDKFARCTWRQGPLGVPLLEDCPRRFVGRVLARHGFGDHVGFLLAPIGLDVQSRGGGLSYEEVKDLDPGHEA